MNEPTTTAPQNAGTPASTPASEPTTATAPSTNATNASAPAVDASPSVGVSDTSSDAVIASGGSRETGVALELVKDPVTGKRTIRRAMPQQVEQAPSQAEQAPVAPQVSNATPTSDQAFQVAQGLNSTPERYTLDEFSAAIAVGDVDAARVPEEYSQQYANYKIHQAMQAYAESQKQIQEQRQQVEQQLSPEERQQAIKDFYAKVNDEAKERALNDMGLTEEELEELEFEDDETSVMAYKAAFEWRRQQLIGEVQQRANQEQAAKVAQQNIYQGILSFVNEARSKEPNFNAIDQIMQSRYKTLPYEKGRAAEEAIMALRNGNITEAQTEVLRQYYEDVRKEYYAEKNNLSTAPKSAPKPPVVENSGNGYTLPQNNAPDYAALRNAGSIREKKAWLQNFLNVNKVR